MPEAPHSVSRPPLRSILPLAYGVFFASGAAALLYQVVWQRMLTLFSGADVFSVTLVVSAFMAGLGIGNWIGGHFADRLSRAACLGLFATAELAIAGFALASKWLYYDLLYARLGALDLAGPLLFGILFVFVLWPTLFMGISLPLLARGLTPSLRRAPRTIGSLYGWNTLGAATGAFVTVWILLRFLGFEACIRIGALANFACAAAALPLWALLRARESEAALESVDVAAIAAAPPAERSRLGVGAWLAVYALSGFIALSLEIAWFRALGVMLKSSSFTFGTLLAIYLTGTAAGSLVGSRLVDRGARAPAATFFGLQTGAVLWAVLALAALVAALPEAQALASHFGATEQLPLGKAFTAFGRAPLSIFAPASSGEEAARQLFVYHGLLPIVLVAPATLLMGMSFPFLQMAVQTDADFVGRRVGWLQTANIAGSLTGSLVTGFVLLPSLGTAGSFRLLACAALAFPLLALHAHGTRRIAAPGFGLVALLAAAFALPSGDVFWTKLHGLESEDVLVEEDATGVSMLRPIGDAGVRAVMAHGLRVGTLPFGGYAGTHTLLGALPALIHPDPRQVAVIGVGSGDTAYAAAARPGTQRVAAIEIIGSQIDLLRRFDAASDDPALHAFLTDPRIEIVVDDGRSFLRRDSERFDVIEADALRPTSAYAGNLYSVEYFALLRSRLAPGGLAVTWLPTPRVLGSLLAAFPHVLVLGDLAFGSDRPIHYDIETVRARAREPAVRAHFAKAGIDIAALVSRFVDENEYASFGPRTDRSLWPESNSDLFARDEFVVRREGPAVPLAKRGSAGPR